MLQNGGQKDFHIINSVLHQYLRLIRSAPGNGEDGSLFRFHNRLICRFHCFFKSFRENGDGQYLLFLNSLGKAAEQL